MTKGARIPPMAAPTLPPVSSAATADESAMLPLLLSPSPLLLPEVVGVDPEGKLPAAGVFPPDGLLCNAGERLGATYSSNFEKRTVN